MSTRALVLGGASLGAVVAVVLLLAARPDVPLAVQALAVVAGAVLGPLLLGFVRWRQRRDLADGERFGNALLERLRRRRDGDEHRPGGPRVVLDPDALRGHDTDEPQR